jgi:hypothetical protein
MTVGPSAAMFTLLEKLAVDNGFDRVPPTSRGGAFEMLQEKVPPVWRTGGRRRHRSPSGISRRDLVVSYGCSGKDWD